MKQILQNLKSGATLLEEVPCPRARAGQLLIQTSATLVSVGTERMLVDFGKANLIDKARQQPDKVCMVLDEVKTDGLLPTLDAVRNKLDQPLPMGYCNVGWCWRWAPGRMPIRHSSASRPLRAGATQVASAGLMR